MKKQYPFNYLYFGFLFFALILLHISHVLLVDQGSFLNRSFYIIHAMGQCLFEVGALALIGVWITEKFPTFMKPIFILGTFLLFLMHLVDFPLMRIMDMSIWYSLSFIFAESFDNFIEMLKASNIQLMTWCLIGASAVALAVFGLVFFQISNKLSSLYPLYVSYNSIFLFLVGVIGSLTLFDYHTAHLVTPDDERGFLKALPWKTTFFAKAHPKMPLHSSLPQKPSEEWYQKQLSNLELNPLHRPNIYLFIVESLRDDFIIEENAPYISQFRQKNLSFPCAVSAANATPLSWFSLFHSTYAFEWGNRQPRSWSLGSLPLQILKKAGYQIHVISSSQLVFYQMDQMIFGKQHALVDDYNVLADQEILENHAYDAKSIDLLLEKMQTAEEGHLFIVFLEGTHFDYSWPPHLLLPTRPVVDTIDYLRITYSKADLEGIKNRYRHAIYHIDHQFHRFQTGLQNHPRGDEAVVILTSDHGEEFFEEGRIFHASNLNRMQTHVPLYYQLGNKNQTIFSSKLTSHLDIFPTLLHYLFGKVMVADWFDGESILQPRQKPFALSTRFNASRTPYEFLLTTEDEELTLRFDNTSEIQKSKALEILSRKSRHQNALKIDISEIQDRYQAIFDQIFTHP